MARPFLFPGFVSWTCMQHAQRITVLALVGSLTDAAFARACGAVHGSLCGDLLCIPWLIIQQHSSPEPSPLARVEPPLKRGHDREDGLARDSSARGAISPRNGPTASQTFLALHKRQPTASKERFRPAAAEKPFPS
ncbi:uncharacterized protein B0T15DRAFT_509508 [Chaetomium strumarium]|uniref:Uncharacterized protein n=1 Tax=Chaetomium strumarium TaxID=1170767 RepID=A0AAJ0GZQ0_9PEZI|nr:hypothetical protein B0T15DRAFT_509508 [Chaetomium strumarium]